MESFDTREAITALTLDLLSRARVRRTARAPASSCRPTWSTRRSTSSELLDWAREHPRAHPFTIRLVKGAYWDHEVVQAAQHGWAPPVFTDRRACDRNFELLTRAADRRDADRPRRDRHPQPALDRRTPPPTPTPRRSATTTLEFQILRGLGDDTQAAIAATGRRVRAYCPVGDLVAGMAYLVRRLLENTANDSFLAAHASGTDTAELLEAP